VTRIVSGIVLIGLVLAAVLFAPAWVFLAVVGIFLVLGFVEYADLASKTGLVVPRVAGATAALAVGAAVAWPGLPMLPVLAAVVVAVCALALGGHTPAAHVPGSAAATLFPAFYLGVPLGLVAAVRAEYGPQALLFVILAVAVSDTAQFVVGSWFGKHRLAPAVSPKKSVEGALGGLAASAAVTLACGHVAWPHASAGWLIGMGVVLAGLGITGDLFESLLKRSAGVKDSSNLIPGHGGILDRIDALLLVVPGYYLFLRFLN
jgi:phosphatidate cytidylyltransferase